MKGKKILLVEDDENLGFVIKDNLQVREFEVVLCKDGESAWQIFLDKKFDLCLLDIMLPKLDGLSLAKKIREKNTIVPIIFLTAKSVQEDKLAGFEVGADDYITKPFSVEELIYRIGVFLKRSQIINETQGVITIGNYVFDANHYTLKFHKDERKLTRREAEILQYLYDRVGMIVKRNEILIALWGDDDYFKGRSLDVFISKLRKYLSEDKNVDIENHHGVGFKLVC